jgi:glucose-1-phosphate cytidylyltransferase
MMKAVILAGGLGTRIAEESATKPKPMIEIGGKPILWHIMKIYSHHGINDFIICCGYKGYLIKEYFANYLLHTSDITIDISKNSIELHQKKAEPWRVTLIDTGDSTQTGGRLKRIKDYISDDFCMTYGDGVGSIDVTSLLQFHKEHGKLATMTAVKPPGRFGALDIESSEVKAFQEKPQGDGAWINGGFCVLKPEIFDLIESDDTVWEREPLEQLALKGQLRAYLHSDFWQPMDTLRDRNYLEELWLSNAAPWRIWDE